TVARSVEIVAAAGAERAAAAEATSGLRSGAAGAERAAAEGATRGQSAAPVVRVVRVTPDGDETVEVSCPAVVTISNELGQPRYPTMAGRMAARKKRPASIAPAELGLESH